MVTSSSQDDIDKRLRLAFKLYDSDNNKKIDKKEMLKMIILLYDMYDLKDRKGELC